MAKFYKLVWLFCLVCGVAVVSYNLGKQKSAKLGQDLDFSLLYTVREKLAGSYLDRDKMDPKQMSYGAIKGFVEALGDPYTVFLPPTENKASEDDLKGEFGGVGISLGYKDKNLAVMTTLPKTPAEKASIQAGDLITKIIDKEKNIDRDTSGISLQEAVSLIRGKSGSEVTLQVYREGFDKPKDFVLTREIIDVPAVELNWKEYKGKQAAIISLNKFSEKVYTEWPEKVEEIMQKKTSLGDKYAGIVLDLRNNPGGYLEASVLVASDFLKDGVVVSQQDSNGKKTDFKVDLKRRNLALDKLVVLVNGGSASAAEILAGALHDYNRAKLIGEKTFGKGTVQVPENFSDGSGIHITIAKWLLPSGKNIHKVGVDPDVELKWSSDPKEKDKDMDRVIDNLLQS